MPRGNLGCRVVPALILWVTLCTGAGAQVEYLKTLRVPTAGDAFLYPKAVTADLNTGEVFVCDTRGHRVLIFDAEGLFEYEINGGTVFRAPFDIGIDPDGYLILLANHEARRAVLELDFDGLFLREIRLSGLPDGIREPQLTSLALSSAGDRIYLLDRRNVRVWIANRDGEIVGSIDLGAEMTEEARRDALFGHVDVSADRVLVGFPRAGRIRTYDLDGTLLSTIGAAGSGGCELSFPVAVVADARGHYLVVDSHRSIFSTWDVDQNLCLSDHYGFGYAPGYLYFPTDLTLDAAGRIYVSQPYEGRVQVYQGEAPAARVPEAGVRSPREPGDGGL